MVVVSITILLLTIGVAAATRMTEEARRTQTRAMLEGLKGANEEFKFLQRQSVNIEGSVPINWSQVSDASKMSSIERFVFACEQNDKLNTLLQAAIKSGGENSYEQTFRNQTGSSVNEIYDRWRTQIEYRPFNNGKGSGPGTGISNDLLPITQSAVFVSAGKDKVFGTNDDIHTEE